MNVGFRMHAERTPNPNSIKWVLGQAVANETGSASFERAPLLLDAESSGDAAGDEAGPILSPEVSPLASAILEVAGVEGVYLGANFVTVTKDDPSEWTDLAAPIVAAIKEWAATGDPAIGPAYEAPILSEGDAVVSKIVEILERDIRPYVEADGGEIVFAGFNDGVVEVSLQGSCAGCPSSSITLKMGIEARLKEEIPEVSSVVAV